MSTMPALKLLMGFGTNPSLGNYFVLDRSTLNGSATLASDTVMVNVSEWLTGQLTISRGRSREVDAFQAGSLNLTLRNEDRRFDPTNTASPYYPGIVPHAAVELFLGGQNVFGGYVDDYDLGYGMPATATVAVSCLDGFSLLSTTYLQQFNADAETTGQRIADVVARPEVAYPGTAYLGANSIETGQSVLQAKLLDQITALDACQTAANSEGGLLYCGRAGTLHFRDRTFVARISVRNPNGVLTLTDTGVSYAGPAIAYEKLGIASAATLLYTRVQGQRSGGAQQTADNAAAQASYGIRTLALPQVENQADADVLGLCGFYLNKYSAPEVRFSTVGVQLVGLDPSVQQQLALLDIGSVVVAERTPPGGGGAITQLSMVEHLDWSMDASVPTCMLTLGLQDISASQAFTLDNATFGLLDSSTPLMF